MEKAKQNQPNNDPQNTSQKTKKIKQHEPH